MVDVESRAICLSEYKIHRFWDEDVHKVFGVPWGNRDVKGSDGNISPESIEFLKTSLGIDKVGAHSLHAAEELLKRDIKEDSSKIDKDCFQIAFVIFVMGHLLAPSTMHAYCQIEFWGALANTENIAQFKLVRVCATSLQALLDAVAKLKKDMMKRNITINYFGCHIFLQVTLRRMITMAGDAGKPTSYAFSSLRHASDVCYTRSKFLDIEDPHPVSPRVPPGNAYHC